MRPLRLEIQGLTSYRQPIEVDFSGLDLFAIWGPTGAGKTSLVDAITYALYGQVPRMKGSAIKELITQGEERMRVMFEFSADGGRYRVHRATARKGSSPVQLDQMTETGEWLPLADRATEVTHEIERILRMDYGAFIRSVLLPQGEFDRFLAGDRDERRKIIDGLLQLGVYGQMLQRANAIAAKHADEAETIRRRLEEELADATPEALKEAKTQLKDLERREKEIAALKADTEAAARQAETLAGARERVKHAAEALKSVGERLQEAKALLEGGEQALKTLDDQIAALQEQVKETGYDADLHMRLNQCLPMLREIDGLAARAERMEKDLESGGEALEKLRRESEAAAELHTRAAETAVSKREEYEEARKTNAAALLRSGLKTGDPCPVCGQKVPQLGAIEHLQLDQIKAAAEKAAAEERKAQQAAADASQRVAVKEQELAGIERQLVDARADIERRKAEARKLLPEPEMDATAVDQRIRALDAAKKRLDDLEKEEDRLAKERDKQSKAMETARTDVARLETEAKGLKTEAEAASKLAAETEASLRARAREMGWDEVPAALEAGRNVARVLASRVEAVQAEAGVISRDIGSQTARIEQIQKELEKARELREEEKRSRKTATLARDLASLLRTDRFPTFIRERALRTLAEDGSQRLSEISGGRYDFAVEGQDFVVVDRWNGGEERSVKTLSGGETFLASLALALALAEQLPSLAGGEGSGALDSIFIDEGFSHLDNETLDVVASALEAIGAGGDRMVGVITHLSALAERMPARIVVDKHQSHSTVTIE